ncbi:MAG: hypothetical protein AB1352_04305 [Patescibacteria group bacterium]
MSTDSVRRRRRNLMREDPYCHWCRRALRFYPDYPAQPGKRMPDDFPTIDHLHSRLRGRRPAVTGQCTLVLSCPACNNRRNVEEARKHIWITRWKSASFPRSLNWLNHALRQWRNMRRFNSPP